MAALDGTKAILEMSRMSHLVTRHHMAFIVHICEYYMADSIEADSITL